jgi:hypothetical protein
MDARMTAFRASGVAIPSKAEAHVDGIRRRHHGPFGEAARGRARPVVRVGTAARWRPRHCPAVEAGLEGRRRTCGDADVVDEGAESLNGPVARVRDRDLHLLACVGAEVDRPLLPAGRAAGSGVPLTRRPSRRASADSVERLVVVEPGMELAPAARAARQIRIVRPGALARVPVGVRKRRPVVLPHGVGLDEREVPIGLRVARNPERQIGAAGRDVDRPGQALVAERFPQSLSRSKISVRFSDFRQKFNQRPRLGCGS